MRGGRRQRCSSDLLMPIWLLSGWRILKPFAPYIGIALAVLAAWLVAVNHGKSVQREKDRAEIAAITRDRDTWKADAVTLVRAIDRQNAAVTALKADADKRTQEGTKALEQARKANAGLLAQAEALRKSAGLKYGKDDPCVISDALVRAGKI